MALVLTCVGGLFVTAGIGWFFVFLVLGLRCAWKAARSARTRPRELVLGSLWLGGAALLVGAAFLAIPIAERLNDWSDRDHDGMLDGFSNGGYGWLDINGTDWIRAWGLLDAAALSVAGVGLVIVQALDDARPRSEADESFAKS